MVEGVVVDAEEAGPAPPSQPLALSLGVPEPPAEDPEEQAKPLLHALQLTQAELEGAQVCGRERGRGRRVRPWGWHTPGQGEGGKPFRPSLRVEPCLDCDGGSAFAGSGFANAGPYSPVPPAPDLAEADRGWQWVLGMPCVPGVGVGGCAALEARKAAAL